MLRIETLYRFVYELCSGLGADKYCLSTLEDGILNNQIIEIINIYYKNTINEVIGMVSIEIDWEKYKVFASTEEGKSFEIDSSLSILD